MRHAIFISFVILLAPAWGQSRDPHVGYAFPAGGQAGTTFEVEVGGQSLRAATHVYVSGEGVTARVLRWAPPVRTVNGDQRRELERQIHATRRARMAEVAGKPYVAPVFTPSPTAALPAHPMFERIPSYSLRELRGLEDEIANRSRRQLNPQIAESVFVEVSIDKDAAPGARELRLGTWSALSNPMPFHVGLLSEVSEIEPNGPDADPKLPPELPRKLPVLANGQIKPGDVDRIEFLARRGQKLTIDVDARSLMPYLADAVPGWFQPVIALYDPFGREVAFVDDDRFDPDPVLLYEVPRNGTYTLEIRDSIYRGREDFVYRAGISEAPWIASVYPLGGRAGATVEATLSGWNLPATRVTLETRPDGVHEVMLRRGKLLSNRVPTAVDTLPEIRERGDNDSVGCAQPVELPRIVNGRIERAGDVDYYGFRGKKDQQVVAEILARRLHSPMDSLLRLYAPSGEIIAWSDDTDDPGCGLLTHHADSRLLATLPEDGAYCVRVSDTQRHGGNEYAYRLRLSAPRPDFELRVTPASVNIPAGRAAPVTVHALRRDGFDGPLDVVLAGDAGGLALDGGRIPAGCDRIRMTLSAPGRARREPIRLRMLGRAIINGEAVRHEAVPAEDMMQAFLWRSLAPCQETLALIAGNRGRAPRVELAGQVPVEIPAGGSAEVHMRGPRVPENVELVLREPPEGVALGSIVPASSGLSFSVRADGAATSDNLIVEAFTEVERRQGGKTVRQRVSLGVLPAIPVEVVPR